METVASLLERQLGPSRLQSGAPAEEGPAQRLLTSPSVDSMGGLRSPGTATPDVLEAWQAPEIVPPDAADVESPVPFTSPFTEAAQQYRPEYGADQEYPTPQNVLEALTAHRSNSRWAGSGREDDMRRAQQRWEACWAGVLLWFAAALATAVLDFHWFPLGMFSGIVGALGGGVTIYGPRCGLSLTANLQVTRAFALAAAVLATSAALLYAFFLIRLPCPNSFKVRQQCALFRVGLAVSASWHALGASLAAFVAVRATFANAVLSDAKKVAAVAILVEPRVLASRSPSRVSRVSRPS